MTNEPSSFRFEIALSFPGKYRYRVEKIAELLSVHLTRPKVLYDQWLEAENARLNLDLYLLDLYSNKSELLVFFLGTPYAEKLRCGLEWRAGRELLHQRQEGRMMLLRLDGGPR